MAGVKANGVFRLEAEEGKIPCTTAIPDTRARPISSVFASAQYDHSTTFLTETAWCGGSKQFWFCGRPCLGGQCVHQSASNDCQETLVLRTCFQCVLLTDLQGQLHLLGSLLLSYIVPYQEGIGLQ